VNPYSARCLRWAALLLAFHCTLASAAFEEGARFAFLGSREGKSIEVVDLYDHLHVATIGLKDKPDTVLASDYLKAVLVAHRASRRLSIIDLSSEQSTLYNYPLDMTPSQLYLSPVGEMVAVYDESAARLEVHAIRRRERVLLVEDIHTEAPFTFSADGLVLYWSDSRTGTLNSVDLWRNRSSVEIATAGSRMAALSRTADGFLGFVSEIDRNLVHVIDLKTFSQLTSIRVGGDPGRAWGTTDGTLMLVPNQADGTVTAISTLTLQVAYTIPAVANPISINSGWLDTVAAVVGAGGDLALFDVASGKVLKRMKISKDLLPGVVTSDSKTLAVPSPQAGELVLFDMRQQGIIERIKLLPLDIGHLSLAVNNNVCH
jgi:DNA-binding beta-propeller fold protein YncE